MRIMCKKQGRVFNENNINISYESIVCIPTAYHFCRFANTNRQSSKRKVAKSHSIISISCAQQLLLASSFAAFWYVRRSILSDNLHVTHILNRTTRCITDVYPIDNFLAKFESIIALKILQTILTR